MIEVRKTTEKEKAKHSNMAYVIDLGHTKQWFTEKALVELLDKMYNVVNENGLLQRVMPRYILMGIEFNNIWKLPDFYVGENDGILLTAQDDISNATDFDYDNAIEAKEWLQENYNDYTWYMVALNGA